MKILIFHPYLAPYRIDLCNSLNRKYLIRVILTGSEHEISTLAFDLEKTNINATFNYKYYKCKLPLKPDCLKVEK